MGVPGEIAVERRGFVKRRPIATGLLVTVCALFTYLYFPMPAPDVAPARAGDCVELHLYSNGFHSDIGAPAVIFPEDHALRRLYPEARSFLIGWGEERFYQSDGTDLMLGLDAIVPPSPTVFHIAHNAGPSSAYLGPTDDTGIAVSAEGAAAFVALVDRYLVLDAAGDPNIVAPGKVRGRSMFLRSRGSFHLFNVCNHWMAKALRAAGVNVNTRASWMAGPLVQQVRAQGRQNCPLETPPSSRP